MHRKGPADTFPCHSKVYLSLLNEPVITLALWQDLADSPVKLQPDRRRPLPGDRRRRGHGDLGIRLPLAQAPRPALRPRLRQPPGRRPSSTARIVLVVHSGFYREVNGEPWIQHDVEAFVKVDSKGWKALAKTVRPLLEKVLEDQVQEAGWFVSLMGRLVETYPNWACSVVLKQEQIDRDHPRELPDLVVQVKRPNASTGRPQMVENAPAEPATRRR